jgi:two-component system heavy metal sensor histidine kinase CusS
MVVSVLTTLVIRRGLEPVDVLATDLSAIGEQNLSARLRLDAAPKELSPIVNRLNDLLSRLHGAFEREKAFTADAAHELRTPLAGLEAALGVCAKKPRAPEAYAVVVNDCLAVVRGMHAMIDNLLLLARADAQQVQVTRESVRVADLIDDTAAQFSKKIADRSLQVSLDVDGDLLVQTDRDRLLHVLKNLFDNAACYADTGGAIRVSAAGGNPHVKIRIANTGSRISAEDAAHVFDRFWRGDPARSDVGTHCGVGLSVCQKMIIALGGSISASSAPGGEFVVEISLPA